MNSTLHLVGIAVAPACGQGTSSRDAVVDVTLQSRGGRSPAAVSLRGQRLWGTCIRCEQERVLERGAVRAPTIPDRGYAAGTARKTGDVVVEELHRGAQNGNGAVAGALEKEAWELLRDAVVSYCGEPVGTIAANDPTDPHPLNYDQVFIRDFIPSAIAFLLKGETEIVRNFLLHTLQLQVRSLFLSPILCNPCQGEMQKLAERLIILHFFIPSRFRSIPGKKLVLLFSLLVCYVIFTERASAVPGFCELRT
jgi:hypothetical protein